MERFKQEQNKTPEKTILLEKSEFDRLKTKIEKCRRIREDLSPPKGEPYNKERVKEIRKIEMKSEQGEMAKKTGLEELVIDIREYREKRFTRTYSAPNGEKITEQLVMFAKIGEDGRIEWLTIDEGKPLAINADLYNSRISSHKHAEGIDYEVKVIPRIDTRGAYTGIVSIIENKKTSPPNTTPQQPTSETSEDSTQRNFDIIQQLKFDTFEQIGEELQINEQNPPKPESFWVPLVNNFFNDEDRPTLAGKIIPTIYEKLISRPNYKEYKKIYDTYKIGDESVKQYKDYTKEKVLERWNNGDKKIFLGIDTKPGTDMFHFNGDDRPIYDHLFYFKKSRSHWRNPKESIVRAYITLDPQQINNIPQIFVDLCLKMYDAGIDFSAKCSSPNGLIKRTDNIVLYISSKDQPKALEILKDFLTERGVGKGHVMAAIPDLQDGLSWAYEPSEQQQKIWQEVSGSSQKTSFNTFVATMAVARYLERLALACLKMDDQKNFNIYKIEAKRVRSIIPSEMENQLFSNPQNKKSKDIQEIFSGLYGGIKDATEKKRAEYEQRIQAAINGTELQPKDIQYLEQLKSDFLRLGGKKFWKD